MSATRSCGHEQATFHITADYEPWDVCGHCYGVLKDDRRVDEWPAELRAKARARLGLDPDAPARLP